MADSGTILLRKMSLRRALWQARMVAKAVRDQASLGDPERQATCLLRNSVKQQLRDQPLDGFISGVYGVDDEWRLAVLRRDPDVVEVVSPAGLAEALEGDAPVEVLALRASGLTPDRLRQLMPRRLMHKTVFVES